MCARTTGPLHHTRRHHHLDVLQFWDHISDDAKDLIMSMLTIDATKRATATQALQHKWVSVCAAV